MLSYSQFDQDVVVLEIFGKNNFFVDIGCLDGLDGSNTYLLELNGWKGIAADPYPANFENRKNTTLEKCVVYSVSNKNVSFAKAGAVGGIDEHLDKFKYHPHVTTAEREYFNTISLLDLLQKHDAPKYIEYLSIDTEGSEYEILRTFPFDLYSFGFITSEHNSEYLKRKNMYDLLINKGYSLYKAHEIEDYYINNRILKK